MMTRSYAHTDGAGGRPHELIDHLRDTSVRARTFAAEVRPDDASFADLASWSGWLHDLGKYRPEFQDYLFGRRPGSLETQHAIFGAACAGMISARSMGFLEVPSLSQREGSGSPVERRGRNTVPSLNGVSIRSQNRRRQEENHSNVENPH